MLLNKDFKPMLLTEQDKPFDNDNYLFELKYDGMRVLAYIQKGKVELINRRGNIVTKRFPEIVEGLSVIKENCVLDGEIIAIKDGKPNFNMLQKRLFLKDLSKIKVQSIKNPVMLVIFDVLYYKESCLDKPLLERKEIIKEKFKEIKNTVISEYVIGEGKKLYEFAINQDLEGIVAKVKNSAYIMGKRTNAWIKIKNINEADFIIGGYIPNKGDMASLALGEKTKQGLKYVGNVTIGKSRPDFEVISNVPILDKSPFINKVSGVTFIEPKLRCTIKYLERTETGGIRHAVYKGLRFD